MKTKPKREKHSAGFKAVNLREVIDGWLDVDLASAGDQQGTRVIELAV